MRWHPAQESLRARSAKNQYVTLQKCRVGQILAFPGTQDLTGRDNDTMKIISILFVIVLFGGCAKSSFTGSADDDIKLPKASYSRGEIAVYEPVSRVDSPWWIVRARKGNTWGYVDSPGGKTVIPFVFDFADDLINDGFSRQYARVQKGGKWGFINLRGETVIPLVYDYADQFKHCEGDFLAKVSRGGRTFMISTSGIETTPQKWCEVLSDTDVWVENTVENLLRVSCDRKYGFAVEKERAGQPGSRSKRSPLKRYYNSKTLTMVVPAIYDKAEDFKTLIVDNKKINLARVQLRRFGFINEKGEAVIPAIYDSVDLFNAMPPGSGKYIARAELKKKFGYINEKGKTIIPFLYERAGSFSFEKAIVVKNSVAVQRGGKWGFIDYTGRITIPIVYDQVPAFQRFLLAGKEMLAAIVQRDGKAGYLDPIGKEIVPVVYDRVSSFQHVENEGRETFLAEVIRDGKHGFTDNAGTLIIPLQYERVFWFQTLTISGRKTSVVRAMRHGRWGFIDAAGKILIPFKYEDVDEFHERGKYNVARVKSNGKWIYIDDADRPVDHTADFSAQDDRNLKEEKRDLQ